MLLRVWYHNTVVCILHNGEGKIAATYLPSGGTKIGIWSSVAGGLDKFDVIKNGGREVCNRRRRCINERVMSEMLPALREKVHGVGSSYAWIRIHI